MQSPSSSSQRALRRRIFPVLMVALATACGGGDEAGGESDAGAPRSALLVTFDTTRADALGCYGGSAAITPQLDRLAREGVLFERAYTVAPITLPAHATMLSGLYPVRHGVRHNGLRPLPQSAETLAERASAAGFQTAAFVGAVVLDSAFGLDQGFDVYDAPAKQAGGTTSHFDERSAGGVVDRALSWLRARDRSRPFFLWVHFFDPHAPYLPPQAYRDARYENLYLGELAYADAELGRLLDALRKDGSLDETSVMFVADHGEAFGEHQEVSHSVYCYEPTLHVPMILRRPDGERAGSRVDSLVSVVDVHPTLAAAMGLDGRGDDDGENLFDAEPDAQRGVYFESYYGLLAHGWSPLAGWMDARGKYLHSSVPEFFDVVADPTELRDLADERDVRPYRDAIAALADRPALELGDSGKIDAELQSRIEALGYAGVDDAEEELPHPLAPSERASPASRAGEYALMMQAMRAANEGRWADAEALCVAVLAKDPENPAVLEQVATARIQQSDYAGAIAPLRRLLSSGGGRANLHYNLGISLWQVGRLGEASDRLLRTLELAPEEPRVLESLINVLRADGRQAEAEIHARTLRALGGSR